MTENSQQQPGEVNILHRGVGAFVLIALVLVLLKGLLREQRVPAASVGDFAAAVALPAPGNGYRSTVQLDQSRKVLTSISVPVKIPSNRNEVTTKTKITTSSKSAVKHNKKSATRSRSSVALGSSTVTGTAKSKISVDKKKIIKSIKNKTKKAKANVNTKAKTKTKVKAKTRAKTKAKLAQVTTSKKLKAANTVSLKSTRLKSGTTKTSLKKHKPASAKVRLAATSKKTVKKKVTSRKITSKKIPHSPVIKKKSNIKLRLKKGNWVVQIGLYSSRLNASRVRLDLKKRGYPVVSMPMKTGKGLVTRLWIGPYEKRSSAAGIKNKIITIARYKHSFIASNPLLRK